MKTKQEFPTDAVCGIFTGICLGGFADIHEVMDHLYPGVMTIGCAFLQTAASAEILRQHPTLTELGACEETNWEAWRDKAAAKFGPRMEVEGPRQESAFGGAV